MVKSTMSIITQKFFKQEREMKIKFASCILLLTLAMCTEMQANQVSADKEALVKNNKRQKSSSQISFEEEKTAETNDKENKNELQV